MYNWPFVLQLFDRVSCTYSYLLADNKSKEAVLIDPVIDLAERDSRVINDLGLTLKYSRERTLYKSDSKHFFKCFNISFHHCTCSEYAYACRPYNGFRCIEKTLTWLSKCHQQCKPSRCWYKGSTWWHCGIWGSQVGGQSYSWTHKWYTRV